VGDVLSGGSSGSVAIRLSGTVGFGSAGGASALGFSGFTTVQNANATGWSGVQYGGGGSGSFTTGAAQAGGPGAQGVCLVTEFY